jgi:cytochrome d ubiquinol oxidase subunit I
VAANAWMNSPSGFRWVDGRAVDVDPVAAMFNDAWASQALHMVLAAFVGTCFAVAGLHAYGLLREPTSRFHQRALRIAMVVGSVCALLQPLSGDLSAKDVARRQPAKLAAMEAHYHTTRGAPLLIGGIPDDQARRVRYGIELPSLLSVLAFADPNAEVLGLDRVARDQWPNTLVCHAAFQIMVGCGSALMALGLWFLFLHVRRRKQPFPRAFLRAVTLAAPLGFVAVEAGWTVTEVGRQPWIIYGVLRTKDALTPMPGLIWPLLSMIAVYALLVFVTIVVLSRLVQATERALALGPAAPIEAAPHA